MKTSTAIARELFLHGPPGGKRITSVAELVKQSGASERTIHAHLAEWRRQSEELVAACGESGFRLRLSTDALEAHKADCDFLRSEVDRLKRHLRSLSPEDPAYSSINRAMLATEKQWAAMAGVSAALDAAAARLKEKERLEARGEAARDRVPVLPERENPARNMSIFRRRSAAG